MTYPALRDFAVESWRIEGVRLNPAEACVRADQHLALLKAPLCIEAVVRFAMGIAPSGIVLRDDPRVPGVRVGNHIAPPSGPQIHTELTRILDDADFGIDLPYTTHQRFEQLHPFTDGNGRTGRAIWLHQMVERGWSGKRSFLHEWYYQSLAGGGA